MFPIINFNAVEFLWHDKWATADSRVRAGIIVLRYIYAIVRDFFSGQLTMRAMSLVYTTLLSIVPLLAFSFSVLKGFGIHKKLEPALLTMLEPLGPRSAEITTNLIALVDNVRGDWLATFGLAIFILFSRILRLALRIVAFVGETERALLEVVNDLVLLLLEDALNVLVAVRTGPTDISCALFEQLVNQLVDAAKGFIEL